MRSRKKLHASGNHDGTVLFVRRKLGWSEVAFADVLRNRCSLKISKISQANTCVGVFERFHRFCQDKQNIWIKKNANRILLIFVLKQVSFQSFYLHFLGIFRRNIKHSNSLYRLEISLLQG